MRLFKVLDENGSAYHGGRGSWFLPQNGNPGEWMPPIDGELEPCINGYHLCREQDLIHWLGPAIWTAEYRGECVEHDDKIVVSEARLVSRINAWNQRTARLFACDSAEHVLHLCGDNDERPPNTIEIVRRYANGQATLKERAAVSAAAWAAAAAAWNAAWNAERKWQTARLMEYLDGICDN